MSLSNTQQDARRSQILALIADEIALQQRHLALLQCQRAALIACDRAEFGRLHAQHEDVTIELEDQQQRRARVFAGDRTLRAETVSWPEEDRTQAECMVKRLSELVSRIRAQIGQNDALIANDLKLIDFQLNLFVSAAKKGLQYVSSGAVAAVQANRLINRVA